MASSPKATSPRTGEASVASRKNGKEPTTPKKRVPHIVGEFFASRQSAAGSGNALAGR